MSAMLPGSELVRLAGTELSSASPPAGLRHPLAQQEDPLEAT